MSGRKAPDDTGVDTVTGAFSYSGAAIARELLAAGRGVRTLTGHPGRAPAGSPVDARPLDFTDHDGLVEALTGTTTLYNTYWVRFAHGATDHATAVANSQRLFAAAADAKVRRVVHVSITHPSEDSPFPYFRGKAVVERELAATGIPHAVLRPAVLFGGDDVLVNNIAWLLRRLPLFAVGGRGDYRVRAIHVDDLARLCVARGRDTATTTEDAVGPERPTFTELVTSVRRAVGSRARIVRVPGPAVPAIAQLLGFVLRDVLLTADEYGAMASGLADSDGPATGSTRISEWLTEHGDTLGRTYANELRRHF
ncbi:NAD(P)H-binding protein [Streptomyces sp. NPDC051976]|uniref:SDR family oxidoreductase n=1 Tax=Streptomyces sp. NPDC051976 TaxID=3154947 RepID=UPI003438702B